MIIKHVEIFGSLVCRIVMGMEKDPNLFSCLMLDVVEGVFFIKKNTYIFFWHYVYTFYFLSLRPILHLIYILVSDV